MINGIVSAYYCEDFLANRLINLIESKVRPVVVCQSGSEEHKITTRFDAMTIVTQTIPTVYDAWNIGLDAHGDYILIANSDDRLYPGAVAKMKKVLDENPDVGLVYSDFHVVTDEFSSNPMEFRVKTPDNDLYDGCYIGSSPMYRRSLHQEFGLFDGGYKISGDYEFWLRLQRGGVKFHHIPEFLYRFWDRGNNLEFAQGDRMIWEQAKIRRLYGRL